MTTDGRKLEGDVVVCHLDDERVNMRGNIRHGSGPTSRTLIKNGALSVTLVSLAAGGTIREHHAKGPISVHILHGRVRFVTPEGAHELAAGDLLSLGAGIRHSVESAEGAQFLITIASPDTREE